MVFSTKNLFFFIYIFQANIQHDKAPTGLLCRRMKELSINVALIQEPWYYKNKVRGMGAAGGTLFYCTSVQHPRACIYVNNVTVFPLPQFCGKDLVALKMKVDNGVGPGEVVICSAYFPYEEESPPRMVEEIVRYCGEQRLPLIMGCDSNSHHTLWGNRDVNRRGEALLEFLNSGELEIANRGAVPTFFNIRSQSVVDLTLCSGTLLTGIKNWRVSSEVSLADHRHILFQLEATPEKPAGYRNPRSANWELYKEDLRSGLIGMPTRYNDEADIEISMTHLTSSIITAYERSCPLKQRLSTAKTPWWNSNLEGHRKEVRRLFNKAKRTSEFEHWEDFKEAQKHYKKALRNSRRQTWRSYCEGIDTRV